jgi:hypothetical protein
VPTTKLTQAPHHLDQEFLQTRLQLALAQTSNETPVCGARGRDAATREHKKSGVRVGFFFHSRHKPSKQKSSMSRTPVNASLAINSSPPTRSDRRKAKINYLTWVSRETVIAERFVGSW